VAIDNREEGRALAKEVPLPADLVVDYNDTKATEKIKEFAGRGGLAAVIGCCDYVEPMSWVLNTLRPKGILVPVGLPVDPGFQFSAFTLNFQELTIKGSLVSTRNQAEDMMEVVAKYGIKGHITTVSWDDMPKITEK
jgi:D-arabinose 1-dehydrogenase-like Zn-dependent alcohol dehydrogenase